nr:importin beta-related nuclear transport receptor [Cryptomonas curvata]
MKKNFDEAKKEIILLEKISFYIDLLYNYKKIEENWEAQKFLTEFQNQTDAYLYIPLILQSNNQKVVYFGLQIIEKTINYNWHELLNEEKQFLQNLITNLIFRSISNSDKISIDLIIIRKMNLILVKIIIKSEGTIFIFLKDLIQSAKISEYICENNLNIILLLFDEIFSKPNPYQASFLLENHVLFIKILKEIEFLCYFVLNQKKLIYNSSESLISITLNIFSKIITIAPPNYILEDHFIENFMFLCTKNKLKNIFLDCLIEMINSRNILSTFLLSKIIKFFILQFQEIISISIDIATLFKKPEQDLKQFIINGVIFFLNFLKNWSFVIDDDITFYGMFMLINQIILKISCVPDLDVYKICIDWWTLLIEKIQNKEFLFFLNTLKLNFFNDLKVIIITRMAKPEEVLLIENENGSIVREITRDTDSIVLYSKCKEILIYLAKLKEESIISIILKKLSFQFNKNTWNRSTLNSLCWSIGAISGIFGLEAEKTFLVSVIKDLLCLAELKKGKENKAVIASDIMYIVGQYPRFLQNHWKFLKTVIYKLFEFMNENHPGVQDMACDTFLKIGKSCSKNMLILQSDETQPFFDEILESTHKIIKFLEFHHIEQFYETLSIIIKSSSNEVTDNRYISKLFENVNSIWFNSLKKKLTAEDITSLKKVTDLLRVNKRITRILEEKYYFCIKILFFELRYFYDWSIRKMAEKLEISDSNNSNFSDFLYFKNEILDLIESYIVMTFSLKSNLSSKDSFFEVFLPIINNDKNFLKTELGDPGLILFSIKILKKCKEYFENSNMVLIFEKIFIPTLDLIKINFESYPDIRKSFFVLIKIIISEHFLFLFKSNFNSYDSEKFFQILIHSVIWGIKHPDTSISKICLKNLLVIFEKVKNINAGNYFYSKFFKQILIDLVFVIIDKLHVTNVKLHCKLFFHLISDAKSFFNIEYLKYYVELVFTKAFPNINKEEVKRIILIFIDNTSLLEFETEFKQLTNTINNVWQDLTSDRSVFKS